MIKRKEKIIDSNESIRFCFWLLLLTIVFGLFSYGYCVRGAIVNIVVRQNMEAELSSLTSKVIDLEAKYIKIKNNITPELAQNLGFIAVSSQKFVTRNTEESGLSLLTADN